jgi:ribonuclease-3
MIPNNMQNVQAAADQVAAITGDTFTNELLCAEATQMASPQAQANFEGEWRVIDNNKRLSILGDSILAKVLCAAWSRTRKSHGKTTNLPDNRVQVFTMLSRSTLSYPMDDHT